MRSILFTAVLLSFMACGGGSSTGADANLVGFETSSVGNTGIKAAIKKNASNEQIEKGYTLGGKKDGTWLTYYTADHAGKIKTIASYVDGMLNGPYLELSNRGQIDKEVNYENNMYNGRYVEYKFGRIIKEANYRDNKLDGTSKDYYQNGNVQKEINFKGGKQHGSLRYYNEEGAVTVEYDYKDGEKLSGGMVEKE